MKKIVLVILCCIIIVGCSKKENIDAPKIEKMEWNTSDFSIYGLLNFDKPTKYDIENYSKNTSSKNALSVTLACKDTCSLEDVNEFSSNIFENIKTISNGEVYKAQMTEDLKFELKDKINLLSDSLVISSAVVSEYQYVYKYNKENIIIYIGGDLKGITLSLNKVEVK